LPLATYRRRSSLLKTEDILFTFSNIGLIILLFRPLLYNVKTFAKLRAILSFPAIQSKRHMIKHRISWSWHWSWEVFCCTRIYLNFCPHFFKNCFHKFVPRTISRIGNMINTVFFPFESVSKYNSLNQLYTLDNQSGHARPSIHRILALVLTSF
jgi:hypothetical protein